ncbi:ABC transporter permease [Burkholderia sp. AU42008]|uniref:ABC transporter permease n=1 Tax=unclassified Burkholderia TaxID=2613784 RepID=UPI000B7A61AD|nr:MULTISPECIES: ABC transporter permease [unclassified Burkholderia]MBR8233439.1 ABC transporter permease [Burkholderia sp. AU32357]MBY4877243.1 ABC transporter permease [Burkholderia sp. AU42008]OXI40455.1 sulfonate ABC transporter [Burkholderia sp. AU17457]
MSDTAFSVPSTEPHTLAVPPRRAAPVIRLAWQLAPWVLPALLFALWSVGSARGWIAPQILPPPERVIDTLAELASSGDLVRHTLISLQRVLVGFAAGTLLGVAIGVALGLSRTLEAYVLPSFNALVQIPVLGWLPFLLLLVGVGEPLKYLLIAHAALVPVTLSTLQGFRQAPPALDEVARGFGYTRRQRIVHVVLPAAIPTLATGVRLAFTKSWLALVVVELVASSEGLGYLIVYGRQLFQLDLVMAAVVVVGAVGLLINRALDALEARLRRGVPSAFRG